jgi:hypothetical protein
MRNTCAGVGHLVVHAGHAMRAQHHPYVAVIVYARFVDPDRGGDSSGLELVERGDARAQPEVRRAVVTDTGSGFRQPIDVPFI